MNKKKRAKFIWFSSCQSGKIQQIVICIQKFNIWFFHFMEINMCESVITFSESKKTWICFMVISHAFYQNTEKEATTTTTKAKHFEEYMFISVGSITYLYNSHKSIYSNHENVNLKLFLSSICLLHFPQCILLIKIAPVYSFFSVYFTFCMHELYFYLLFHSIHFNYDYDANEEIYLSKSKWIWHTTYFLQFFLLFELRVGILFLVFFSALLSRCCRLRINIDNLYYMYVWMFEHSAFEKYEKQQI